MLQKTTAPRAIYSITSVTVLDPFLFHFVVTYFVRPSAMISDVVVSLPGGSVRSFGCSCFGARSTLVAGRSSCLGLSALSGRRRVINPATNAQIEATTTRVVPHQREALNSEAKSEAHMRNIMAIPMDPNTNSHPIILIIKRSMNVQDRTSRPMEAAPVKTCARTAVPRTIFIGASNSSSICSSLYGAQIDSAPAAPILYCS